LGGERKRQAHDQPAGETSHSQILAAVFDSGAVGDTYFIVYQKGEGYRSI
jgi:hypothetical protein